MELDPRWEWAEGPRRLCDAEPKWVKVCCLHTETTPVTAPELLGGEVYGDLCLTCDTLLRPVAESA